MKQRTTVLLPQILVDQEQFYYQGETWTWKKTGSGLHVVGSDRKGLWGDFTNGSDTVRIHKGDLIEAIGEENANKLFRRNPYPIKCFVYVISTDEIGVVTRGELGYRPALVQIDGLDKRQTVDRLNAALDISKAHVAAMNAGAIFGWECPAAKPGNYDKAGQPKPEKWKQLAESVR